MADSRATLQKRVALRDVQLEKLKAQVQELKDQVKVAREYVSGLETENGDLRLDIRERRKANRKLQEQLGRLESELFSVLHRCCMVIDKRRWAAGPARKYVATRLTDLGRGGAKIRRLSVGRGQKVETTGRALETVRLLTE